MRRALLELYGPGPDGLAGNDDGGTMGAWWVFGALGMYPAVPGTDVLALGSPLFPRVTIRLPRGTLRIEAPRAAPGTPVRPRARARRQGMAQALAALPRIAGGARLRFRLGAKAHLLGPAAGPGAAVVHAAGD